MRRSEGYRATERVTEAIDRIVDEVTHCAGPACDATLDPAGPHPDFCSEACWGRWHREALASQVDPRARLDQGSLNAAMLRVQGRMSGLTETMRAIADQLSTSLSALRLRAEFAPLDWAADTIRVTLHSDAARVWASGSVDFDYDPSFVYTELAVVPAPDVLDSLESTQDGGVQ